MTQLTNDMRRARVLQFSDFFDRFGSQLPHRDVLLAILDVGKDEPKGGMVSGMVLHEIGELSSGNPSLRTVSTAFNAAAGCLMDIDRGVTFPEDHRRLQDAACILLCFANLAAPHAPTGGVRQADAEPLLRSFTQLGEQTDLPHVADIMKTQCATLTLRTTADALATMIRAPLEQTRMGAADIYADLVTAASAATARIELARIMRRPTAA